MPRSNILSNQHLTLEMLKEGRRGAIQVSVHSKPNCERYKRAQAVCKAIDKLAANLTGEIDYFHTKAHG